MKLIVIDADTLQITDLMNTIVGEIRRNNNKTWDVYYDGEFSEEFRTIDEFVEYYTREQE